MLGLLWVLRKRRCGDDGNSARNSGPRWNRCCGHSGVAMVGDAPGMTRARC